MAFPPLSAASARGGTGVSLLLRRHGQAGFVEANWWIYPTDALAYFADCPALATELQANRYHARSLPQLVRRYNSCPAPGRPYAGRPLAAAGNRQIFLGPRLHGFQPIAYLCSPFQNCWSGTSRFSSVGRAAHS